MILAYSTSDGTIHCLLCKWEAKAATFKETERELQEHMRLFPHERVLIDRESVGMRKGVECFRYVGPTWGKVI